MNNAQYIKDCHIINGAPSIKIEKQEDFISKTRKRINLRVDTSSVRRQKLFLRAIGFDASFFVATS